MLRGGRISALISAALLLLCCCACGGRGAEPAPTPEPTDAPIEAAATPLPMVTAEPTPTPYLPVGSDFYACMNELRMAKNRFYNVLDGALAEDSSLSFLLYDYMDFVYGDSMLDLFKYSCSDLNAFSQALAVKGFTGVELEGAEGLRCTASAMLEGLSYELSAEFDYERGAVSLRIRCEGETVKLYEWLAADEGCAIQYCRAVEGENAYEGYRAFIGGDGSGRLSCGSFSIGEPQSIFDSAPDPAFTEANMFSVNTVSVADGAVTARHKGEVYTHVIGDIPAEPTDDPEFGGDEP